MRSCTEINLAYIITPIVIVVFGVMAGVLGYCIRKMIRERNLANNAWKLNYDEINLKNAHGRAGGMFGSQVSETRNPNPNYLV